MNVEGSNLNHNFLIGISRGGFFRFPKFDSVVELWSKTTDFQPSADMSAKLDIWYLEGRELTCILPMVMSRMAFLRISKFASVAEQARIERRPIFSIFITKNDMYISGQQNCYVQPRRLKRGICLLSGLPQNGFSPILEIRIRCRIRIESGDFWHFFNENRHVYQWPAHLVCAT